MTRRTVSLALGVALAVVSACGDEDPAQCGTETCSHRETCDSMASPPMCVCAEAYTGDECAACAVGYRPTAAGDCEPVPIDCDADPLICGDNGVCVVTRTREIKTHSCECNEGWAGHVCQRCDTGWQDNDGDGTCLPTCEMVGLTCDAPHVCSDAEGIARCACPPGYAGDDCTLCARGYHDPSGSGECTPTCSTAALECGERQTCNDADGAPECVCVEGYTGIGCLECAPGWQEGAIGGDCRPTCAAITLDCSDRGACVDGDGIPQCACEPGWAGARCETCARGHRGDECEVCESGWFREGDAACVPSCGSGAVRCGAERRCWDGATGAECVCEIGYAGPACDECATGFVADAAGSCVAAPSGAHTLIASGSWLGEDAIVAIDPAAGSVAPLRSASVDALAYDPTGRRLFARVPSGIARVDLATGMTFSTISTPTFDAYAYDRTRNALVLIGSSGVRRLDPGTSSYMTLSTTAPSFASDAAYEASGDRVLVTSRTSSSTVSILSAATGAAAGTLAATLPIETSSGIGIATTVSGELWVLGRRALTEDESAAEACREAARGILGVDYAGAPATVAMAPPPGGMVALASARASGPEVIVLRTYGTSTLATVRVTATNPDAVVCIGTYQAAWRIDVAASARFLAVIAESYEDSLSARIETGYPTPPTPTVHVRVRDSTLADPSLTAAPDVVRVYSDEEWYSRRIAVYGGSVPGSAALFRLDRTTGAVLSTVDLPGFVPEGSLAPFAP